MPQTYYFKTIWVQRDWIFCSGLIRCWLCCVLIWSSGPPPSSCCRGRIQSLTVLKLRPWFSCWLSASLHPHLQEPTHLLATGLPSFAKGAKEHLPHMESFSQFEFLTSGRARSHLRLTWLDQAHPKSIICSPKDYEGVGDLRDHLRILPTIKNAMNLSLFNPLLLGGKTEEKSQKASTFPLKLQK